jgi:hypothetical protein
VEFAAINYATRTTMDAKSSVESEEEKYLLRPNYKDM